MARSYKDGRSGGGHRKIRGEEFWSRRPLSNYGGCTPGKWAKQTTHRIERRRSKMVTIHAIEELMSETADQVDWDEFNWDTYENMVWELFYTGLWVDPEHELHKEDVLYDEAELEDI